MTRINTNVSSLNAQKTLARSNADLQEALTRLSTGLRINSGKDDPAGLIASETLRADIVSTEVAISNSQRANQMIATADSALGQVSSLLNDVRGLVSEAANEGAVSAEQIAANQLQLDSSLEAIDRIAQVTQFQGRRLLDGSLDFVTQGVDSRKISNLAIDQANFGTQTEISVSTDIVAQAEKAQLTYGYNNVTEDMSIRVGGSSGFEAFNFAAGSSVTEMAAAINLVSDAMGVSATVVNATAEEATAGSVTLTSAGENNDIVITADATGAAAGDYSIKYVTGAELDVVELDGVVTITVQDGDYATGVSALGGAGEVSFTANNAGTAYDGLNIDIVDDTTEGAVYDVGTNTLVVTQDISTGDASTAHFIELANADANFLAAFTATEETAGSVLEGAAYDDITSGGVDLGTIMTTAQEVIDEFNLEMSGVLSAAAGEAAATGYVTVSTEVGYYGSVNTGSDYDTNDYLQFLGPDDSSDLTFNFVNGGASQSLSVVVEGNTVTVNLATDADGDITTTAALMATALNANADLTAAGISVSHAGTSDGSGLVREGTMRMVDQSTDGVALIGAADIGDDLGAVALQINATEYGSKHFVSVMASEVFETVNADGEVVQRDSGEDIDARINGIQTVSDGLNVSINTSSLDVAFKVDETVAAGANLSFTIVDGGAQFQLGPDVVSNQQARLGIQSVNTSTLGGASGQMFQLRSGGLYSLANDTGTAAKIVEEAIVGITTLRGRLGAFQKTTVETNINALNDTLEALTDAESSIRDADFAAESANLTRAQILVQSGTSVLVMANQNPQNVLALLR